MATSQWNCKKCDSVNGSHRKQCWKCDTNLGTHAIAIKEVRNTSKIFDYKRASPTELRAQYDLIAKETGDDRFFTSRELSHLPKILMDREQVIAFSSGLMDGNTWLIVLTDKRIIFIDKGMVYGLKQTFIDLDKVNSVSCETGFLFGKISIEDGASAKTIDNVLKKTVVKFTNKVRDAIEATKWRPQLTVALPTPNDLISTLERLALLRQSGILTQQEFSEQKTKFLGRSI